MGIASRLISGSVAGWASIALTVITQIGLVPLFLQHWSVPEFGVWITIQAMFSFCTALSTGLKTYAEFEFLKSGSTNVATISALLWSTLPAVLLLALFEIAITMLLTHSNLWFVLLDLHATVNTDLARRASWVLLMQMLTWLAFTTSIGLFQRAIVPFGYYPRNAWWYLAGTVTTTLATVIAVLTDCDIVETSVAILGANLLFSVAQFLQLAGIFRRHGIRPCAPDWRASRRYAWHSLGTGARNLLELIQAQGIRVLLTSSVGLKEMTTFSTTRTINNVGLQAIGTVTNPILPELMAILNNRDDKKLHGLLWMFWFFTVGVLAIGLNLLQAVAPTIFHVWTLGKIRFDPVILALLSSALLVFGMTQPLVSIVRGNNLQRVQLLASIIGASLTVFLILAFAKVDALRAASSAILFAEVSNHLLYRHAARNWLTTHDMLWFDDIYRDWLVMTAVGVAGIATIAVSGDTPFITLASILVQGALLCRLIVALPPAFRHGMLSILRRQPV